MKRTMPSTSEFRPAEEMCSQFCRAFNAKSYWAEKALLAVLLKREGAAEQSLAEKDGASANEEHLIRRARIFQLLGLHKEASRILNSLPADMEVA